MCYPTPTQTLQLVAPVVPQLPGHYNWFVEVRIRIHPLHWLFGCFCFGLIGTPGRKCRFSNPQNIQQALSIALTVDQEEKQECFNDSFYTKYDKSVRLLSRSPGHKNRGEENSSRTENTHSTKPNYRASRRSGNSSWSAQTESALRCYECQGIGHFGRECPTRLRREIQNAPGKKKPSGRSRRSHSPGDKPAHEPKRGGAQKNRHQGNE